MTTRRIAIPLQSLGLPSFAAVNSLVESNDVTLRRPGLKQFAAPPELLDQTAGAALAAGILEAEAELSHHPPVWGRTGGNVVQLSRIAHV